MRVDALVIAGGYATESLQNICNVTKETLIPIGDKVMVEYVVGALEKTACVESIMVAGPIEELKKVFADKPQISFAPEGENAIDSVLSGLKLLKPQERVLIITADIPLITPEAIEDFIDRCIETDIDVFYPIVPMEANDLNYPGMKRTYAGLKDGIFTGGNMFFVNPKAIPGCAEKSKEMAKHRKSPVALCGMVGWTFILKLITKRLTIKEIESKFYYLLGVTGKAVISDYPGVSLDVDKPSDLELVNKILLAEKVAIKQKD